jgi:hypothetical protein
MVKLMDPELLQQAAITYSYVFLWIGLSAGVILFNKYLLSDYGFPYPVALTMIHMGFCSVVAALVVRVFKWIPSNNMEVEVYMRSVVPIGFLYAVVLWLGNTAYLYLSVSFIQMLKVILLEIATVCSVALYSPYLNVSTIVYMLKRLSSV